MSAELILNLINEVLDNPKFDLITEQEEGTKTVIKFPKFKINERHWGKNLDTEDRAVIERIGSQLRGNDPLERVAYLQQFLTETEQVSKDITVGEVMGALMFLDIFASVVYEFNASVAGFLFEALFAGIFEGFQIEAKEGGGEAGTTDVILNVKPQGKGGKKGVEYSFKLLADGGLIKGSFTDIIDGISKSKDASETYLVVLKSGTKETITLSFYEYDINQDNWFEWIGIPKIKQVPVLEKTKFQLEKGKLPDLPRGVKLTSGSTKLAKIIDGAPVFAPPKRPVGPRKEWDEIEAEEVYVVKPSPEMTTDEYSLTKDGERITQEDFLQLGEEYEVNAVAGMKRVADYAAGANFKALYNGFLKEGGFSGPSGEDFLTYVSSGAYKEDDEFFDRLKTLPTYGGGTGAGQFQVSSAYMKNHPEVRGPVTLTLDRQQFQAAADEYSELVGQQIFDLFTKLSNLIDDISGYFLGVSASERNRFATEAKKESKELAESAEENLVEVPEMADPTGERARSLSRQKQRQAATSPRARSGSAMEESKEFDNQLQLLMKEVFGR